MTSAAVAPSLSGPPDGGAGDPPAALVGAGKSFQRYRFQCLFCRRNQSRVVRVGNYVTCKFKDCAEPNPGPRMHAALTRLYAGGFAQAAPRARRAAAPAVVDGSQEPAEPADAVSSVEPDPAPEPAEHAGGGLLSRVVYS